jgi:hypothetical protein
MLQAYKDLVRRAHRKRTLRGEFKNVEECVVLHGEVKASICDFLNNVYWTRLWIVQEIMLARSLSIWWGKHRISREALEGLTEKISVGPAEGIGDSWIPLGVILDSGMSRDYPLGYDEPSSVDSELYTLVFHFCSNGCQDPKDKVFGLVALARSGSAITVDYNRSVEQVYLDAVHAMAVGTISDAHRVERQTDRSDWERFVKCCYMLGVEMLPVSFGALSTKLSYNVKDAGKQMGFDEEQLFDITPVTERGQYMADCLEAFITQASGSR